MLAYLWITIFVLTIIAFWGVNLVGAPGNWMIVLLSALWAWIGPESFRFDLWVVITLLVLALIGEGIEFGASVLGTKKLGGSARGATLSVIGSIIGGLFGAIIGIPIPIPLLGSLIGSILFASTGALVGAMLGEKWVGKPTKQTLQIGGAAFVGRFLGTLGKLVMGGAMVGIAIVAPFFG